VACQSYPNLEVIVVDDGSTENIQSVVSQAGKDLRYPVCYFRQENAGPGAARRVGLAKASGTFIQYLDSDDEILPDKIALQVEMLERDERAVMSYTTSLEVSEGGQERVRTFSDLPAQDLLETALQYRRWGTASCLWRYPQNAGALWVDLYNGEDVVHDVSVGVLHRRLLFVPAPLTRLHAGGGKVSSLSEDPVWRERYIRGICDVNVICLDLLSKHRLVSEQKYAEPLAERFYYTGLKLVAMGEREKGKLSLSKVIQLSRHPVRLFEVGVAITAAKCLRNRESSIYRWLLRVHRQLWPPFVHCYRSLG
jgi:glycosyltransferase involved in cell wall biosynthesis